MKKTHKTQETPVNYGGEENRTPSDSLVNSRPIPEKESDAFVARLRAVIGDESNSAFARRCNVNGSSINEGTIRNILAGAWPRTDNLVAIADAGGVSIDWLATGRLPKTRAELRYIPPEQDALNRARLRMALILAEEAAVVQSLTTDQRADMVLTFYHCLTKGNAP